MTTASVNTIILHSRALLKTLVTSLRRCLLENAGALPARVCYSIFGSALQLHFSVSFPRLFSSNMSLTSNFQLQYIHEALFHRLIWLCHLVYSGAQDCQSNLWRCSGHFSRYVPCVSMHVLSAHHQPRFFSNWSAMDFFDLPRGSGYPSAASLAPAHQKRRYLDRQLCVSIGWIQDALLIQLDIPNTYWAWLSAMDRMDIRDDSNRDLLRLFLLLYQIMA